MFLSGEPEFFPHFVIVPVRGARVVFVCRANPNLFGFPSSLSYYSLKRHLSSALRAARAARSALVENQHLLHLAAQLHQVAFHGEADSKPRHLSVKSCGARAAGLKMGSDVQGSLGPRAAAFEMLCQKLVQHRSSC